VEAFLIEDSGDAVRASDLVVVTAALRPALVEAIVGRGAGRQHVSVVYVDVPSFGGRERRAVGIDAALLRLDAAGIPVAVLRRKDDLGAVLGPTPERVALG
jgi:hypothetical protein